MLAEQYSSSTNHRVGGQTQVILSLHFCSSILNFGLNYFVKKHTHKNTPFQMTKALDLLCLVTVTKLWLANRCWGRV